MPAATMTTFASAPVSPVSTRSYGHHGAPPITPQRITRSAPRPQYHSPRTPGTNISSPYTPLSFRTFSSNESSLTTPVSATSHNLSAGASPDVGLYIKGHSQKSFADVTNNWRDRANENGIKVTSSQDSQYVYDEASEYNHRDETSGSPPHSETFSPSVVSKQRRVRALSYAPPPRTPQTAIPVELCTPNRRTLTNLNTPPPNASIISKLKIKGSVTDPPAPRRRVFSQPVTGTGELFDIDEDEYIPYPRTFSSLKQHHGYPIGLNDPFNTSSLSPITESVYNNYERFAPPYASSATGCSICGQNADTFAILEPCSHPLCSACLTSALNIVGEKDMECAVCNVGVANFHLQSSSERSSPAPAPRSKSSAMYSHKAISQSSIDFNPFLAPSQFSDHVQVTSTPVAFSFEYQPPLKIREPVVIRIDNVPWDITPPALAAWLKHPVERVHVLLDRKGKTLSHVFVEMAGEEAAKAALRTAQNAVLGKGKRARGVTVTRSSQEELMKALFPSWRGRFDGSRPSLAGLPNEAVVATLQTGLMSEVELHSLLQLICSPNSQFVKVPSLPFYALISILSKFPADVDSRVFWSSALRDFLYDIAYAAVQVVLSRGDDLGNPELITELLHAATSCQAFTEQQIGQLADLLENCVHSRASSQTSRSTSRSSTRSPYGYYNTVSSRRSGGRGFDDLAREFGVGSELVEAVAQRLSAMC